MYIHAYLCALFFCLSIAPITYTTTYCNRPEICNDLIFPAIKEANAIRLLTYNIRGESATDKLHGNSWDNRKYKILYLIEHYQPDIISLQGVRADYMPDIKTLFPTFNCITYNVNSLNKDVALLIRSDRFKIKHQDFFWLSEEPLRKSIPDQPSWGGQSPRIVIQTTLLDLQTHKQFVTLCTHFDSSGMESRINSAHVLMHQYSKIDTQTPVIIAGDFNLIIATPMITHKSEEAYALITNSEMLQDIRDNTKNHYGPDGSWIGWPYDKYAAPSGTIGERLDHIFVRHCNVLKEGILNLKVNAECNALIDKFHDEFENTPYSSDHLPVIADILIQ